MDNKYKSKEKLFKYIKAIKDYEIYIKDIYKNSKEKNEYYEGYIVNLSDFDKLKEYIKYEVLKENIYNIDHMIEQYQIYNIPNIRQIKFNKSQELINSIKNGNIYIILNKKIYQILSNEDMTYGPFFGYFFYESELLLIFKNNEIVYFKFNNNILNEKSLIQNKTQIIDFNNNFYNPSNTDGSIDITNSELLDYFESIIEYYNFNLNIFFYLNSQNLKNLEEKGYLVYLDWISMWKKNIFYEEIKTQYFKSSFIDENHKKDIKIK